VAAIPGMDNYAARVGQSNSLSICSDCFTNQPEQLAEVLAWAQT
jgi:hypothetical protein